MAQVALPSLSVQQRVVDNATRENAFAPPTDQTPANCLFAWFTATLADGIVIWWDQVGLGRQIADHTGAFAQPASPSAAFPLALAFPGGSRGTGSLLLHLPGAS